VLFLTARADEQAERQGGREDESATFLRCSAEPAGRRDCNVVAFL